MRAGKLLELAARATDHPKHRSIQRYFEKFTSRKSCFSHIEHLSGRA